MAETTGISWATATFNPWVGCAKVSPGCANCYAETWANRYVDGAVWGDDGVRRRTSDANWRKPLAWNRAAEHGYLPNGKPSHGARPRVFCASLADVFEPRPELIPWRRDLLDLIDQTPHLDWLLLTKRPEIALVDLVWRFMDDPPKNLWVGTSIENAAFTWRALVLQRVPAAVRFLSCEPLVGSLYPQRPHDPVSAAAQANVAADGGVPAVGVADADGAQGPGPRPRAALDLTGIDWVIVGGESGGPQSRPMHPQWAREIRNAVLAHGGYYRPALHMKQWGSWRPALPGEQPGHVFADGQGMVYAGSGPTAGGKLLDGRDWCEIPESPALVPA